MKLMNDLLCILHTVLRNGIVCGNIKRVYVFIFQKIDFIPDILRVSMQYVLKRKKTLAPWMIAKFRQIWHSAVKWKELFLIYFFSIPATFSFLQVRHVCKFRAFFFCYVNVFASDLYSFAKAYSKAILFWIEERKGLFFLKKKCVSKKKTFTLHF